MHRYYVVSLSVLESKTENRENRQKMAQKTRHFRSDSWPANVQNVTYGLHFKKFRRCTLAPYIYIGISGRKIFWCFLNKFFPRDHETRPRHHRKEFYFGSVLCRDKKTPCKFSVCALNKSVYYLKQRRVKMVKIGPGIQVSLASERKG